MRSLEIEVSRLAPSDWSPYTTHDLCGIPSRVEGLGAYAPAQCLLPIHNSASRGNGCPLARRNWR